MLALKARLVCADKTPCEIRGLAHRKPRRASRLATRIAARLSRLQATVSSTAERGVAGKGRGGHGERGARDVEDPALAEESQVAVLRILRKAER